jgi:predicted aspartyl protease
LDTGAVYTVIPWDVGKDIGYDPAVSERRMPIVTANGVIEAPLITVESIHIADLRL